MNNDEKGVIYAVEKINNDIILAEKANLLAVKLGGIRAYRSDN